MNIGQSFGDSKTANDCPLLDLKQYIVILGHYQKKDQIYYKYRDLNNVEKIECDTKYLPDECILRYWNEILDMNGLPSLSKVKSPVRPDFSQQNVQEEPVNLEYQLSSALPLGHKFQFTKLSDNSKIQVAEQAMNQSHKNALIELLKEVLKKNI